MPSPRQVLHNDSTPPYPSHRSLTSRKSLPRLQLSAIYHEIVDVWSKQQWLEFEDEHTDSYLTLRAKTDEILSIQIAIDEHQLTTGETRLISPPECLLIRSKSKSNTIFIPNSRLSLGNLINSDDVQTFPRFKLLAMISYLNDINNHIMFYKDFHTSSWNIYHEESISAPSRSELLPEDEQERLNSFIHLRNIDPYTFSSPLSALLNHPMTYIYMSDQSKGKT